MATNTAVTADIATILDRIARTVPHPDYLERLHQAPWRLGYVESQIDCSFGVAATRFDKVVAYRLGEFDILYSERLGRVVTVPTGRICYVDWD